MQGFVIATREREEIIDITAKIEAIVSGSSCGEGALMLFCPHTTCGLTINESADPAVKKDLIRFFGEIAPRQHSWLHIEGNTDAHIRSSLLGASLLLPIANGELRLGTWQAIYLYEGDGPRQRNIWLQFLTN